MKTQTEILTEMQSEQLSNCCGAKLITEQNGIGICSECKEWAGIGIFKEMDNVVKAFFDYTENIFEGETL